MKAQPGDELHFYSQMLDRPDRIATVMEVRTDTGEPPYLVRFADGSERLVFPGSDCVIIPAQRS